MAPAELPTTPTAGVDDRPSRPTFYHPYFTKRNVARQAQPPSKRALPWFRPVDPRRASGGIPAWPRQASGPKSQLRANEARGKDNESAVRTGRFYLLLRIGADASAPLTLFEPTQQEPVEHWHRECQLSPSRRVAEASFDEAIADRSQLGRRPSQCRSHVCRLVRART